MVMPSLWLVRDQWGSPTIPFQCEPGKRRTRWWTLRERCGGYLKADVDGWWVLAWLVYFGVRGCIALAILGHSRESREGYRRSERGKKGRCVSSRNHRFVEEKKTSCALAKWVLYDFFDCTMTGPRATPNVMTGPAIKKLVFQWYLNQLIVNALEYLATRDPAGRITRKPREAKNPCRMMSFSMRE